MIVILPYKILFDLKNYFLSSKDCSNKHRPTFAWDAYCIWLSLLYFSKLFGDPMAQVIENEKYSLPKEGKKKEYKYGLMYSSLLMVPGY